jgi:sugar phosphate permease
VIGIGLPALAPALREAHDLSLSEVGIVLSGVWIGATVTVLPWGLLADRVGERIVLSAGLASGSGALVAAAVAPGWVSLVALLALAGAAGASVNAASGRAVMSWFGPEQRGLALGIRQTSIPIGGAIAALLLPPIEQAGGLEAAFLTFAGFYLVAAAVGALVLRDRPHEGVAVEEIEWTLRDGRIWRLCSASSLYLVAQMAVVTFVVLFLHDERGWSDSEAAAVLAMIQVLAIGARIGAGVWSDRVRSRTVPLRRIGIASGVTLAAVTILLEAPVVPLVAAFVVAGAVSMAWNGLSFTAAAELAGRARSGAAIGFQQTALGVAGLVVPFAFAATVSVTTWQTAFALAAVSPLVGVVLLRPLRM